MNSRLPVRVHAGEPGQQPVLAVDRENGREQDGERAAEAVPRHHEPGARVRVQERAQLLPDGVVREPLAVGGFRWPAVVLHPERLHEAAVDLAHAGDLVPGEVHVSAPLLRVERLRAAERDHGEVRVRRLVREHEGLRRVVAAEF
jgi:hypothetical protein